MSRTSALGRIFAASAAFTAFPADAQAQTMLALQAQTIEDLSALSIEELAQVPITSVSRRAEPLAEAPAAVFVITQEDIRRSPALSLPELLRQAPNLQVQQIDARQFAISARGFNGYETANKLLALIDGRSIYTPLFSGVLWELHSPLLEDLQQIEVVSGPGGTLYGPNAVNGVVNITTKSAGDTLGALVRGTVGDEEQTAALRYGTGLGANGAVRVYGQYYNRNSFPGGPFAGYDNGYSGFQGGFRADFEGEADTFTLQGDIFGTDTRAVDDEGDNGQNVLARWTRRLSPDSSFQLQAYYDDFEREFIWVRDALQTFDASAQFNIASGGHQIVAGAGIRTTKDDFVNGFGGISLDPRQKRLWVFNGFVQDEFALSERLSVTAGLKVERSSFSGTELLPNLRLAWQPDERMLLWSAVSRAVRTPSRIDRDLAALPVLASAPDFQSEKLTAIEAGYRGQPSESTSLSVSVFYNVYHDIRTTELRPGNALPIMLENSLEGSTWGVEAWATQQVTPWWRLRVGVATLAKDFEVQEGRVDITDGEALGNDPDYNLLLRSQFAPHADVDVDVGLRAVDDLEDPQVDAYIEADARVGWRVTEGLELFVAGQNLLHDTHEESGDPQRGQLIERKLHAGTRIRF